MNAPTLLRELKQHGATVTLEGKALRVQPARVLDDELRAAIRCHKTELLELLALESASRVTSHEYSCVPPLESKTAAEWEAVAQAVAPMRDVFLRAVESQKAPCGLVVVSSRLCATWRAAETECGHALTLAGNRREAVTTKGDKCDTNEVRNV